MPGMAVTENWKLLPTPGLRPLGLARKAVEIKSASLQSSLSSMALFFSSIQQQKTVDMCISDGDVHLT